MPTLDSSTIFKESNEFPDVSMRSANRHFPPVVHNWSTSKDLVKKRLPLALIEADIGDAQRNNMNQGLCC